jgi:tetratricopeptide (TPR) repeat protein
MKAKHYIPFLLLLPGFLVHQTTRAQKNTEALNIRGDTFYLNIQNSVVIVFPSLPMKADINNPDGSYEVDEAGKNSLSIKAVKNETKDQMLEVVEGSRNHLFVLSYKDGSPAQRIDVSSKKKLEAYAREKKKNVTRALLRADSLFKRASNNSSDQALWENVEATYQQLEKAVDSKEVGVVKSRMEESRKAIKRIKENIYAEAIKKGQDYFFAKKYKEAKQAYKEALEINPGDAQALKNIWLTDSVWVKDCISKGDEANMKKNFVLSKSYYSEGLSIKPDDPDLQNKFNQVKKLADPLIYKIQREKGDLALKTYDTDEARSAYDSALSVRPDDLYIKSQMKKVIVAEEKINKEERDEAIYQDILTNAKVLTGNASSKQDYELAINEYKKASVMFSNRKFPKKMIDELTRLKNGVRAN